MRRRTLLASGASLAGASAFVGCLGLSGSDETSVSEAGLAPNPEDVPAPDVNVDSLELYTEYDPAVPLLPIDAAHAWYLRREARFVDARSLRAYEEAHVAGAVSSPAPTGQQREDPTEAWPDDERIVTYCTCPHHLSTLRASNLISDGHAAVFAIDEGFRPWVQQGYPIAGDRVGSALGEPRTVRGTVDTGHAGEWVWVRHGPTGQREPGQVRADGSFAVTIHFVDLDAESPLTVETPAWTETAPLGEWTADGA